MFARLHISKHPEYLLCKSSLRHLHTPTQHIIMMFYQGDLQSGISEAVREAKLVACFVTGIVIFYTELSALRSDMCLSDEGEESQLWESDFLQDEEVSLCMSI